MLKKLFVHEWKDTWSLVGLLNLIVVGLTIIGMIMLNNQVWIAAEENGFIMTAFMLYIFFYIASVAALGMIVSFYFFARFYKNLYTDQGYLMHTLPVNAHQLIWSKTFVAFIWMIISGIVTCASMFGLFWSMMDQADKAEMADEFSVMFEELFANGFDIHMIFVVFLFLVAMVAAQLMSIFMGYASISIGQTFKKQKVLGAIGVYIGIYMLLQTLGSYLSLSVMMVGSDTVEHIVENMSPYNFAFAYLLVVIIICGGVAAAFYFLTHYLMKNKLNLE